MAQTCNYTRVLGDLGIKTSPIGLDDVQDNLEKKHRLKFNDPRLLRPSRRQEFPVVMDVAVQTIVGILSDYVDMRRAGRSMSAYILTPLEVMAKTLPYYPNYLKVTLGKESGIDTSGNSQEQQGIFRSIVETVVNISDSDLMRIVEGAFALYVEQLNPLPDDIRTRDLTRARALRVYMDHLVYHVLTGADATGEPEQYASVTWWESRSIPNSRMFLEPPERRKPRRVARTPSKAGVSGVETVTVGALRDVPDRALTEDEKRLFDATNDLRLSEIVMIRIDPSKNCSPNDPRYPNAIEICRVEMDGVQRDVAYIHQLTTCDKDVFDKVFPHTLSELFCSDPGLNSIHAMFAPHLPPPGAHPLTLLETGGFFMTLMLLIVLHVEEEPRERTYDAMRRLCTKMDEIPDHIADRAEDDIESMIKMFGDHGSRQRICQCATEVIMTNNFAKAVEIVDVYDQVIADIATETAAAPEPQRKTRGRPKKQPPIGEVVSVETAAAPEPQRKTRGRPKKQPPIGEVVSVETAAAPEPQRKRGRPKKQPPTGEAVSVETAAAPEPQRKTRGRPKKQPPTGEAVSVETAAAPEPQRKTRGRPKKQPPIGEVVSVETAVCLLDTPVSETGYQLTIQTVFDLLGIICNCTNWSLPCVQESIEVRTRLLSVLRVMFGTVVTPQGQKYTDEMLLAYVCHCWLVGDPPTYLDRLGKCLFPKM
jgi:hypothetical protein